MQMHLPDYFLGDLIATVAFGVVAFFLVIIGYIAFAKLTPKLDFDDLLNKGNVALAVVIGSFILGLSYVIGRVVAGRLRALPLSLPPSPPPPALCALRAQRT